MIGQSMARDKWPMREKEQGAVVITKATTRLVSLRKPARRQASRARPKVSRSPSTRKAWGGLSGECWLNSQLSQATTWAGQELLNPAVAGALTPSPSQPNRKRGPWQALVMPKLSATWSAEVRPRRSRVGIQAPMASRGSPRGRTAGACQSRGNRPFNRNIPLLAS